MGQHKFFQFLLKHVPVAAMLIAGCTNADSLKLKSGDVVAFTGGTNAANMNYDGYLETLLTSYYRGENIKFRNLGWEGDNVYEQFRDVGFGNWFTNLDSLKATTIFVQFGQMECLEGKSSIPKFIQSYKGLLDTLRSSGKQIIILSPNPFEPELLRINDSVQWNNPLIKTDIEDYCNAIKQMATEEKYTFVDLYHPLNDNRRLTYDGVHLNDEGQLAAAEIILKSLGIKKRYHEKMEPLRREIATKNKLWIEYWRPGNWAFYKGDRTDPAFSRHWADYNNRIFPLEVESYGTLIEEQERKINDIVNGKEIVIAETAGDIVKMLPAEDSTIKEELSSFILDKNYDITLFASELDGIAEPTAMRWDEKGRLWVLCIPTYPQPLPGKPANDKLVVLEDRDKDGRVDTSTVFAEDLNIPLGFELGHNGVYLGEQTRLMFLKDTNNDLRCDTREVLLSGFGTHDSHQTINSFTWSPGGELFFAHGLSIHSYVETAFGLKSAHRASIWRYRPVSKQLDNIVDQNGASENPWGITFGDWGELFSKSNDTGVFFTSPALILSDHKSFVPEIGGTHIKSGIVEIPRSSHLPEDIRNDFLIAGYYNNKIERIKVEQSRAGYKGRLIEPLLSSTGKNFRPVDIKTGPDGAIYVLDWYNPIIGHYQASLRDPARDKLHGRIWRITAKKRALLPQPELDTKSSLQLFDSLSSNEHWVRYQTRRVLYAKPANEVFTSLRTWIAGINDDDDNIEKKLMAALTVYENFEIVNETLLQKVLKTRNPGARAYALQVAGRWSDRIKEPLKLIEPFLDDPHPRVRLMAIVACGHILTPESMTAVASVLQYPMDKFTRFAFERAVFALRENWEPAFRKGTVRFSSKEHTATIIGILAPEWYTASMYRELLHTGKYSEEITTKLLSGLANVGSSNDIEYILKQLSDRSNLVLIEELRKKQVSDLTENSINLVRSILKRNRQKQEILLATFKLATAWNMDQLSNSIREIITAPSSSSIIIAEGINTLVSFRDEDVKALLERYILHDSKQVRLACIRGFAKVDIERSVSETINEIDRSNADANIIRETLRSIMQEPGGLKKLTQEIRKKGLKQNLVQPILMVTDQLQIVDEDFSAAIRTFKKEDRYSVPRDYSEQFVTALAKKVIAQGNSVNGAKVYRENACASCHAISGKGGNAGPNLSAIGRGLSIDDIITEVIWPDKNIKEGYNSVLLLLKTGESVQGIRVLENGSTISIKANPSAQTIAYNKRDLIKVEEIGSAMPEGLAGSMTEQNLRDLIRYLSDQKDSR